jgi:hypothetical protein
METEDEKHWFENEVLVGNGTLIIAMKLVMRLEL